MLKQIISGGQTGADQAALDFALEHAIPHGGWCPKGRLSEDGCIPEKYRLREMPTAAYPARTEKNVLDSDGTVIISLSPKLSPAARARIAAAQRARWARQKGSNAQSPKAASNEKPKRRMSAAGRKAIAAAARNGGLLGRSGCERLLRSQVSSSNLFSRRTKSLYVG